MMKSLMIACCLMAADVFAQSFDMLPGFSVQDYKMYVYSLPGGSNEWGHFVHPDNENTNRIHWRCHAQRLPPTAEQMATFTTGEVWNAAHKQAAASVWNTLDPQTKGILAAIELAAGTNATRNQILRRYWQTYTNSLHGKVED